MREFAEEEIIIPDGPYKDLRYRCDRQPYSAIWFSQLDGRWHRHFALGPTQSGKTLTCFVIPAMYHLFEIGETVICGVPTEEMASDKWREDFEPAIKASRYEQFLPDKGDGSRGGIPRSVEFTNGATLKFMTAGGGDKKRAAFTSRVLVVTETDAFDEVGGKSREADKFTQLEGRLRAFTDSTGTPAVTYAECTVSIEDGRTWREYKAGSESRIVRPCPHCGEWVCPEREHLVGWQAAETESQAYDLSEWTCPDCGEVWTEEQRRKANSRSQLVHKGQTIAEGEVSGSKPETSTLGFRWSAVDNQFVSAGSVGADEYAAIQSNDEENAEKEMRQFVFALPHKPPIDDLSRLAWQEICERHVGVPNRGIVPDSCVRLSIGMDVGKFLTHWALCSFAEDGAPHVVDYGVFEVLSKDLGVERAILSAMDQFHEMVEAGWPDGMQRIHRPGVALIDSGYQGDNQEKPIYDWCEQAGDRYWPAKGHGTSQDMSRAYGKPKSITNPNIVRVGDGWHIADVPQESGRRACRLLEFDADKWKSWLHARWSTPMGEPGAATVFRVVRNQEHLTFAKHLTAEKKVSEYKAGVGMIEKWERERKDNHWFDAHVLSAIAGSMCGAPISISAAVVKKRLGRTRRTSGATTAGLGGWG